MKKLRARKITCKNTINGFLLLPHGDALPIKSARHTIDFSLENHTRKLVRYNLREQKKTYFRHIFI